MNMGLKPETHHGQNKAILEGMRATSARFYADAIRLGNHPFIEFTGLMNEYILACEHAHKQGIDFTQCNTHTGQVLPLESYLRRYLAEKLDCIFAGHDDLIHRIKVDQPYRFSWSEGISTILGYRFNCTTEATGNPDEPESFYVDVAENPGDEDFRNIALTNSKAEAEAIVSRFVRERIHQALEHK